MTIKTLVSLAFILSIWGCKTTSPYTLAYSPVVLYINPDNIHSSDGELKQDFHIFYHKKDPTKGINKREIRKITLNSKNSFQYLSIYMDLENKAKQMGANYIQVDKVVQHPTRPEHTNTIKASLYHVENIDTLALYYDWDDQRQLQVKDYQQNSKMTASIQSNIDYKNTILLAHQKEDVVAIYTNRFIKSESYCKACNELDLARENLKFDMIELIQRQQVKMQLETIEQTGEKWHIFDLAYPYENKIEEAIEMIDKISDPSILSQKQTEVNQEIKTLASFKHKTIPVYLGNF